MPIIDHVARFFGHHFPMVRPRSARRRASRMRHLPFGAEILEERTLLAASAFGRESILAASGDPAPNEHGDTDGAFTFSERFWIVPVINDNGQVAFGAGVSGRTGFNGEVPVLFRGSVDSVSQIVGQRQDVPGTDRTFFEPGSGYDVEFGIPLNKNNEVLFASDMEELNPVRHTTGLFLADGSTDSLAPLVASGDSTPDGNGVFTTLLARDRPVLNDTGQVAFYAYHTAPDVGQGVFMTDRAGNLVEVFPRGTSVPGGGWLDVFASRPTINASGHIAAVGVAQDVATGNGGQRDLQSIFRSDGNGLTVIAQDGQSLPGGGTFRRRGPLFNQNNAVPINDRGQVAFTALTDAGTSSLPDGVFVGDGTQLVEIVRRGQTLDSGDTFAGFYGSDNGVVSTTNVVLNNHGHVAFVGSVVDGEGVMKHTLLRGDGSESALEIAREGQRTPRGDLVFDEFLSFAMNDSGQVAFLANLDFPDGGDAALSQLFYDDSAGLIEVVRAGDSNTGDTFEGSFLSDLRFAGTELLEHVENNRDGLNEQGLLTFQFTADRLYIAVVDPVQLHNGPAKVPFITAPGTETATTMNARETLRWTSVADAVRYRVWYSRAGESSAVIDVRTTETEFTPTDDLRFGAYNIWVQAELADGSKSDWSTPIRLNVQTTPEFEARPTFEDSARPTLRWNQSIEADTYELWVNNVTTRQSRFVHVTDLTAEEFTFPADLDPGTYRAWVRGRSGSAVTAWSNVAELRVRPQPTELAVSTFSKRPELSWQGTTEPATWHVYVRDAGGQVIQDTNVSGTTWAPTSDLSDGRMTWWVRATIAGRGTWWSEARHTFIGGRTEITAPAASTSNPIRIEWQAVDGADRYDVFLLRESDDHVTRQIISNETSFAAGTLQSGSYRVWVRAIGTNDELGYWSRASLFSMG